MREYLDVPYLPDGHGRHLLDVFLPGAGGVRPLVVVLHGGGLRRFGKERMRGVSRRLAAAGFAAVTPNYRLLGEAPYPAALEDCLAVLEWVRGRPRELAGARTERPGLLGASAGAFLALVLAGRRGRERLGCLVSVSGPVTGRRRADGGLDAPLALVAPHWPPVLLVHNRNDGIVPVEHAGRLGDALATSGVPVETLLYERQERDHGIWRPGSNPPVFLDFIERRVVSFLERWLSSRG